MASQYIEFFRAKKANNKEIWRNLPTKKHSITVVVCPDGHQVECTGTYWSEGSRAEYVRWVKSGEMAPIQTPRDPMIFGGIAPPSVGLQEHEAIIKMGVSRGKTAHLMVFIQEKDLRHFNFSMNRSF